MVRAQREGLERREWRTPDGMMLVGDVAGPEGAPLVILMHGGGQTRHSWHGAQLELARLGYRAISFDARGHGESSWSSSGDYSFDVRQADLEAIARSEAAGALALVGASMGGMTAMWTLGCGGCPSTRALVLVDITPRPSMVGVNKIRKFMLGHPQGFATLEEAADAVAAYNPHRPRPADPSGLMKNLRLREDGRLYWHWDPRILSGSDGHGVEDIHEELARVCSAITTPTLLVRGGDSDVVDDTAIADMRRLMPQVMVHDVRGAGHMVAGDRNDAFNRAIIDFLVERMPPGAG